MEEASAGRGLGVPPPLRPPTSRGPRDRHGHVRACAVRGLGLGERCCAWRRRSQREKIFHREEQQSTRDDPGRRTCEAPARHGKTRDDAARPGTMQRDPGRCSATGDDATRPGTMQRDRGRCDATRCNTVTGGPHVPPPYFFVTRRSSSPWRKVRKNQGGREDFSIFSRTHGVRTCSSAGAASAAAAGGRRSCSVARARECCGPPVTADVAPQAAGSGSPASLGHSHGHISHTGSLGHSPSQWLAATSAARGAWATA